MFTIGMSYGQQFGQNTTGVYDDCSIQYAADHSWNSYIGSPPNAYGSLSQSSTGGAMVTQCTNIYCGSGGSVLLANLYLNTGIDISNPANQVMNIRMKSTVAFTLNFQMEDGGGSGWKLNWGNLPTINIPGDNTYHTYHIDFSGQLLGANSTMTDLHQIDFYYYGTTSISPTLSIDNFNIGNPPIPPCLTTTATSLSEAGCVTTDYPNYYWTAYDAVDNADPATSSHIAMTGTNGTIVYTCTGLSATSTSSSSLATFDIINNPTTSHIDLSSPCAQKYFVRLKSTNALSLSLQLRDGVPNYKLNWDAAVINVPGDNTFHDYNIDFSTNLMAGADLSVVGAAFLVRSSMTPFTGVVTVDSMSLGGVVTLPAEPTTAATNIIVSNVTLAGSASINWTNGNGSKRLVTISLSGMGSPVDGINYTANTGYGLGSDVASGLPDKYVLYDGTGSSTTVTGLSSSSDYTINVYEYNQNACGPNYYLGNLALATRYQLAAEPTTGSSGINFTSIGLTSMNVNWVNGNGDGRIIIARQGSPVNQFPVDFTTTYTANQTFGAGTDLGGGNFIVYDGLGSSNNFLLSGLTASTNYYFAVIEYKYAYQGYYQTYNYRTSPFPSANAATLTPEPTSAATNLSFSLVTNTTMDVSWLNGGGSRRLVLAHAGSAVGQLPIDYTAYTASATFGSGTDLGGANYIVYDGTANTFSLSGLTAGITYYFSVFEYNGLGTTANYYTAIYPTGNQATTSGAVLEPTGPATNITFASVGTSSFTINWTIGNGANRLVLVRQGSAVNATPTDNVAYTASAAFTAGTQIGSGNYVVYSGSGNTVSLTGLNPSTTYHVSVFEYNGSGATANFLTTGAPVNNQITNAGGTAEPTNPATAISFTSVLSTSFTVNWTNGNGASRIVVLKQGSAVDTDPSDNTGYTANAAYGSGSQLGSGNYVIYSGTGTSVPVTGLIAGTAYYVEVYEFNGSGATANYLTSSTLTGNQTTIIPEPTSAATAITFTTVTTSSFTINWTSGNGASRIVVVKQGSAVNATPSDNVGYTANSAFGSGTQLGIGNYVVYDGSGSSVNLTGLNSSTTYHVSVFEYNGSGANANYFLTSAPVNNQATLAGGTLEPTTAASSLSFSPVASTTFTLNWTNGDGASRIVVLKQGSAVNGNPADNTGYTANAAFTSGTQIGSGNYVVYSGTGSSAAITGLTAGTTYYAAVYEFNGSGSTANYLTTSVLTGSQATTSGGGGGEPTVAASNINFSGINTFSMTLTWSNGNGAGRVVVLHQGSPVTTGPLDGNPYTSANSNIASAPSLGGGNYVIYNGSGNSVTVTGLTPGTAYYYSVYEYNGSGAGTDYLTSTFATNSESTTSVTAVTDAKEVDKIKLYPNPNTGSVEIDLSDIPNITQIQIVNDLGLLVKTLDLNNASGVVNVNTTDLSSGIYYLMIKKSDNSQLTKKMVRY
jgi:hypothetical protein